MNCDPAVLTRLGVRPVRSLGGRLNAHWLVESRWGPAVLRRWHGGWPDVRYELSLMQWVRRAGWPAAQPLGEPVESDGAIWSLTSHLPGSPQAHGRPDEQRARGRLLAEFHAMTAGLPDLGSRPGWRRCEAILTDAELDATLAAYELAAPEVGRIVRWHLDRAREEADIAGLAAQPSRIVHGDFAPWNLLYENGSLSGVLDFELARGDHLEADFALAWRGKYDAVVHGYDEVTRLDAAAWERITPIWWSGLIELACRQFQQGVPDDGWLIRKLLLRSPIMGRCSAPYS